MNQNKQKEHRGHYFDPRVLENYCRQDVKFIFKLLERQAGKHYFEENIKVILNE